MEILVKYNFYISYIKELENGKANILSKKSKYYKNKKYISYAILIIEKLGLEYNKLQLIIIVRIEISN